MKTLSAREEMVMELLWKNGPMFVSDMLELLEEPLHFNTVSTFVREKSIADAESLKKKSESEIAMAVKSAETTLKQNITSMLADSVAAKMSSAIVSDKKYVQELIMALVQKWSVNEGSLDLAVALSEAEKAEFAKYAAANYKEILDKGLEIKVGNMAAGFSVGPKDGSYQIAFTEELFNAFFSQYLRGLTKELLYNK